MYKCIVDSGWVEVPSLAVLVGKNESGKTSLLKALHKFNPFKPEPYCMDTEWPRGCRKDRKDSQVVCTCRFELSPDEIKELSALAGREVNIRTVEVSRCYSGALEVALPPDSFPNRVNLKSVEDILSSLPTLRNPAGDAFRKKARECEEEARRVAREGRLSEFAKLRNRQTKLLEEVLSPGLNSSRRNNEEQYLAEYAGKLDEASQALSAAPSVRQGATEFIKGRVPTFIYMSDYQAFRGTAHLEQVKGRRDRNELTEEDRTLLTIMELSGLDLDDEVRKANSPEREQRQYDLDDASVTLTRTISDRWKQRRYEVQLRADGPLFYTFVRDEHDPSLIRLEERSRGFQWFFSFDLMFMHESGGTFKNCVILLDDPGLHLHPDGQKDLLRRLEEYAKGNTLIYTTHLPFMVDIEQPNRIRVLSETDRGTVVTDDLTVSQPEAKFVLQSALGISGYTARPHPRRNLIVEGLDDFWVIGELSSLMSRSGEPALPDDLLITAAGGTAEAAHLAAFMVGRGLDVVVLLDSGPGGDENRGNLVKEWLGRFQSKPTRVLYLGECVGVPQREFSVEDMFREKFYAQMVREVHARELIAAGCDDIDLSGDEPLYKRAERALAKYQVKLNKEAVARVIRSTLSRMQSSDDLTQETREMARNLFAAINNAFPRGQ
jgi:energy-coupling factor transporter ATP-binding protein EcfA2